MGDCHNPSKVLSSNPEERLSAYAKKPTLPAQNLERFRGAGPHRVCAHGRLCGRSCRCGFPSTCGYHKPDILEGRLRTQRLERKLNPWWEAICDLGTPGLGSPSLAETLRPTLPHEVPLRPSVYSLAPIPDPFEVKRYLSIRLTFPHAVYASTAAPVTGHKEGATA